PNAGKSTQLAALTAAKPKIANYPFTTLMPNLGVAGAGDDRFVVGDVPCHIEVASEGMGLGDRLLRRVVRSRARVRGVALGAPGGRGSRSGARAWGSASWVAAWSGGCWIRTWTTTRRSRSCNAG